MNDNRKPRRQGDCILIPVLTNLVSPSIKLKADNVLLYGETSGHKHAVVDGEVYEDNSGTLWIKADKETKVVHEEHGTQPLETGFWQMIRQREFDERNPRFVID